MSQTNIKEIEQTNLGVYIWRTDDGKVVGDEDGNYMLIASAKGDQRKIDALQQAARSYGIEGGHAEFRAGSRPISQSEWEEQRARQNDGYVPDPFDLGNLLDEYRFAKEKGNQ